MHVFWFFKEGKTNGHHFSVSFFPCPSLWLFSQVFGVLLVQTIIHKYGRITEFVSCYLQFVSVLKWVLASALEEWTTESLGRWMASKIWFALVSVASSRLDTLFNLNSLLCILLFRPLSGSEICCHFSLIFCRRDMKGKDNVNLHFTSCTWPLELPKLWSYKSNLDLEPKNSTCVSWDFQKESHNIWTNLEKKRNVHATLV